MMICAWKFIAVSLLSITAIFGAMEAKGPCELLSEDPFHISAAELTSRIKAKEAAKKLLANACSQRSTLSEALCTTEDYGEDALQHLHTIAAISVKCPGNAKAREVAQEWAAWWGRLSPAIPYDMRLVEDKFLAYTLDRLSGTLVQGLEAVGLERSLVTRFSSWLLQPALEQQDHYPRFTYPAFVQREKTYEGLTPNSPEFKAAKARELQLVATARRESIKKAYMCGANEFEYNALIVLRGIALEAIACPQNELAAKYAQRWQELWLETHAEIPFDTRTDADHLLDYYIERTGISYEPNAQDLENEAKIAGQYVEEQRGWNVIESLSKKMWTPSVTTLTDETHTSMKIEQSETLLSNKHFTFVTHY